MLIELILNNYFCNFYASFSVLGGIEENFLHNFSFYFLDLDPIWLANKFPICGTSFVPFTAYWCPPSSFELDFACLSRMSKVRSPDANWGDLVWLQSISWWWLLVTVFSCRPRRRRCTMPSFWRQNWNSNMTS